MPRERDKGRGMHPLLLVQHDVIAPQHVGAQKFREDVEVVRTAPSARRTNALQLWLWIATHRLAAFARSRSAASTCLRARCFGGRSALQPHSPLGGTLLRQVHRFAARLCNGTYLGRRGIHIHGARTTMWRGAQQRTTLRAGATRSFEPKSVSNDSDFRASPRESTREGAGALRVRVAHVRAHARAPSTHHRAVALRISPARAVTMRVSRRSAPQPHGSPPITDSHGSSRSQAVGYPHRHDCCSSLPKKLSC